MISFERLAELLTELDHARHDIQAARATDDEVRLRKACIELRRLSWRIQDGERDEA